MIVSLVTLALTSRSAAPEPVPEGPVVEVEETVTSFSPPNNGAGPLWCYGAPLVVRRGEDIFLITMETGRDVPPLCNTRCQLRQRDDRGWKVVQQEEQFAEREPCPLVIAGGDLYLSVNPSLEPPGTQYGPCAPHLLRFTADHPDRPGEPVRPAWPEGARFTDHSYRGIAADGPGGEILLLNIDAHTGHQHWSFRDAAGDWRRRGEIAFPVRACYPQVAFKERAAHVLAIGDIVEPNEEWRQYKREQTNRSWDYVFRRLFYTGVPEITRTEFAPPLEVENVDATAGHIRNLDLWIDPSDAAHLLYLKQSIQSVLMRDRFFPGQPIHHSLVWATVRDGQVVDRRTLVEGTTGEADGTGLSPGNARFHATGDGRLFVVYAWQLRSADGSVRVENRLLPLLPQQARPEPVVVPRKEPFTTFFTTAERAGCAPSPTLDLFGVGSDATLLRYARIRLTPNAVAD